MLADVIEPAVDFLNVTGVWRVAHVMGRREQTFVNRLADKGITVFLPVTYRIRRRHRREPGRRHEIVKERIPHPLIPRYAFFAGDDEAVDAAWATDLMYGMIPCKDTDRLANELDALKCYAEDRRDRIIVTHISAGERCMVKRPHALAGKIGILKIENGKFYLPIDILGQMVETEIEPEFLEPA